MFSDFIEKHPDMKLAYQTYRLVVNSMNISFTKWGEEQCEVCLADKQHKADAKHEGTDDICNLCCEAKKHIERSEVARRHYRLDAEGIHDSSTCIMSTDMQKVMMFPWIPEVKACVFTRCIVAFHQTFAPLGDKSSTPVIGIV